MNELIQCEFCDIYIDFNDYLYHVRECSENMEQNASEFTSYSSLFSSITSALEHSFNQFEQINEDNEYGEDNGDEDNDGEEDNEDGEEDETVRFEISNNVNIDDNYITTRININLNLQRIATDNYHRYSNLEDVNKPVKDIDLVAPLISNELIPYDTNCAICQELISNPARKTLCNHFFCSNCLEPWLKELNKTCPSCLTNLEDMYEKNIRPLDIEN